MSIVGMKKATAMPAIVDGRPSSVLRALATVSVLALGLAGCAQTSPNGLSYSETSYQTRHPIVVDTAPTTLDIPAGHERTHLTVGAKSAVQGFAEDYRRSGAKGIQILVPAGSSNEVAASHLARHAREIIEERGVSRNQISILSYSVDDQNVPGNIRLAYVALKARVASECGVWPSDLGTNFENQNYENFGCATQSNLAAIVADPNDLIAPRGNGPINAERTAEVISDFQANTPPTVLPVLVSDAF